MSWSQWIKMDLQSLSSNRITHTHTFTALLCLYSFSSKPF